MEPTLLLGAGPWPGSGVSSDPACALGRCVALRGLLPHAPESRSPVLLGCGELSLGEGGAAAAPAPRCSAGCAGRSAGAELQPELISLKALQSRG